MPQRHVGAFAFSVAALVLMGRTAHGSLFAAPSAHDREVAHAAIERLGIAHLASRPATMISGGERQLALIASALAQEAQLMVLDEPTAALDFGNQGKLMREIRRLANDGLGVLFTTHDPNHATRFADQALFIREGCTLASGPVGEVVTQAQLERLCDTPVEAVGTARGGHAAFLPA